MAAQLGATGRVARLSKAWQEVHPDSASAKPRKAFPEVPGGGGVVWHALMARAPSQPANCTVRKLNFIRRGYGKMHCKRVIWDTVPSSMTEEQHSRPPNVVPLHRDPLGFALFSRDEEIGATFAQGCAELSIHFGNDLLEVGVARVDEPVHHAVDVIAA